jgi:hypothetical protein
MKGERERKTRNKKKNNALVLPIKLLKALVEGARL